jgi:hypothetical protein
MSRINLLKFLTVITIAGLFVPAGYTYAQESEVKQVEQSKELSFSNPKQRNLTLPFKLLNNLIIIPIQINHSDTLNFILDTGLNTSIICELSISESLDLTYSREVQLQGLGTGKSFAAMHTYGNKINVSGVTGINQDYFVLLDNVFNLSNKLGYQIHGILSFNVFNAFIVEINYEDEKITFHNPEYFKYRKNTKNYVTIPLIIHDTKPYIHLKLQSADGRIIPVKVLFDTGANNPLWLDVSSLPDFRMPDRTKETFIGTGLSGEVYGHLTRFHKIYLDHFELDDVIVSLPKSNSIERAIGIEGRNGSVGAEIIKRFNIILDYPNELITLSKNSNFNDPFSHNMTGIELIAPEPGIPRYKISQIRENSPARRAGLHVHDEIISINNRTTEDLSLNEIYKLFQSREGKKLKITVNRDGERLKFTIELEKFI